ncbi:MAG: hypothetical protein ACFHHU_00275 [Porticoccaceae bacterium]
MKFADVAGPGMAGPSLTGSIKSMEQMPGIWTAIEIDGKFKEGSFLNKPVLISQNGRYVMVGSVYDLWDKDQTSLDSLDAVRRSLSVYPIEALGITAKDMGALALPAKSVDVNSADLKDVYVFIDPLCANCDELYDQIENLRDQYRFQILLVPVAGRQSAQVVKEASCAAIPEQAWDAVRLQDDRQIIPATDCDLVALNKRFVVWQLAGFAEAPVLIRNDGQVIKGPFHDLAKRLQN